MKKNICLLITAVVCSLLTIGCSHSFKYTIFGEMPMNEFEGHTVYLTCIDNGETIDSAIIEKGSFKFKGEAEKTMMGSLRTFDEASNIQATSIIVIEKGKIHINMKTDSLYGTPMNELFYKTYTADSTSIMLRNRLEACTQKYFKADSKQRQFLMEEYDRLAEEYTSHTIDLSRQIYSQNTDNVLGAYALNMIVESDCLTYDSLNAILKNAAPAIADYEPLRKANTRLFHIATTAEGKRYTDFEGISFTNGKTIRLSSLIDTNKVTLVDFWASWCSPCRKEISDNLVRLYKKYGNKGLNIIGVDVWDKIPSHKDAVAQLGITYPQIIDTTRTATELYGIDGVPQIILLDKKGVILHRDLRGNDIETAVLEALKMN